MPAPSSHAAGKDLLRLENQSETDILNIRVTAGKKDFFLRLDLAPNDSDEVENQIGRASCRERVCSIV